MYFSGNRTLHKTWSTFDAQDICVKNNQSISLIKLFCAIYGHTFSVRLQANTFSLGLQLWPIVGDNFHIT